LSAPVLSWLFYALGKVQERRCLARRASSKTLVHAMLGEPKFSERALSCLTWCPSCSTVDVRRYRFRRPPSSFSAFDSAWTLGFFRRPSSATSKPAVHPTHLQLHLKELMRTV
jgi:hypothetical protein